MRAALSEQLICLALSTLAGLLLISIFPFWGKSYLAWIALVPLLWILMAKKEGICFLCGFWAGTVFFYGLLYWLSGTMVRFGGLPLILSNFLLLLLCFYLGLYIGTFSVLLRYIYRTFHVPFCILAPTIWVSLEFLRSRLLTGFPWGLLGYSQVKALSIIQMADITGVYGISFLIVFVNAALTDIMARYFNHRSGSNTCTDISNISKEAFALSLALTLFWVYGSIRLKSESPDHCPGNSIPVTLVQGNIPQETKSDIAKSYEILDGYGYLSLKTAEGSSELIIWPETACTATTIAGEGRTYQLLSGWAKRIGSYLLLGCPRYDMEREGTFNSAFLISPAGNLEGFYDKIHLVPFGEYFPSKWAGERFCNIGSFLSGTDLKIFKVNGKRFAIIICFEAIFPELCRKFVKKGAGFMVNLTNDAWFGRTAAPYQHFDMACLRSVENRVWLVRAANTGISAFVNPWGRVIKKGGTFEKLVLEGTIFSGPAKSFYTSVGDFFAYFCLLVSLSWCILLIVKVLKGESRYV